MSNLMPMVKEEDQIQREVDTSLKDIKRKEVATFLTNTPSTLFCMV